MSLFRRNLISSSQWEWPHNINHHAPWEITAYQA